MSSLKANIILNFINTVTGIIFPVITFPYAARVLMPEGIGVVNFLSSVVAYIVLLTSLGIPMYAVREVAKCRDDKSMRDQTTIEILSLSLVLCLFGYLIVWLLGVYIPQINRQLSLFYVLSLTILFTSLGVNWFYQAVEDFKFITLRALVFRILAAAALFLFVKDKEDLLIYAFVVVGSTVGNNFINFIHLRKYLSFQAIPWRSLRIWKHLQPALRIFIFNLITSIYLNLNTVMLGFMKGDEAVGYYTAGNKLSHVILSMVASLGVVMLPRCSNLVKNGQDKEFSGITSKSYRFVIALSFPCVAALIVLARPIILLFCGKEFAEATTILYWTAPIIIFIGLTNVLGMQILYPLGKENIVIWSVAGGAFFNLILNFLLIPTYGANGAAFSTFVAELSVLVIQMVWGQAYIPFPYFKKEYLVYLLGSIVMGIFLCLLILFIHNIWILMGVSILVGILIYSSILYLTKDPLLSEVLSYIQKQVKK